MKRIALLVTLTAVVLGLLDIIAVPTTATKVDVKGKLVAHGNKQIAVVLVMKQPAIAILAVAGQTIRKTVLGWTKLLAAAQLAVP
jgi:hypothetical protein